ncbi:MAG: LysM domain-containing protein, partial [Planctomycetota bacterium]|nr:LysM domain-containing protein [Planctomycetota bacterium]
MARHFTIYLTASGSRASNASYLLPGIAAGVLMVLSIPAPALGGERQMPDRLGEIEQSSPKLPRQPTAAPAKKGETTKDPSKDRREKAVKAANSGRELGTSDPINASAAGDPAAEGAPGRDRDMDEHPLAQWTRKLLESKTPAERELAERALEGWQKALLEPGREVKGAATHEVRPGETLSKIAASYGTTPEAILRLNCQVKSSKLVVGQKLKVLAGPFEARVDLASCR